jgi:DNA-binding NarL/FixJ family response regulator
LRILVVDHDAFFRRGVRETLNETEGMRVVGEAGDGEQALAIANELKQRAVLDDDDGVDLVLIDLDLPGTDGLTAVERLAIEHPRLAVVVLTLSAEEQDIIESLRRGAVGFLSKSLLPEELVATLRAFQGGQSLPLSRAVGLLVLEHLRHGPPGEEAQQPHLTAREREVMVLVAAGARDREIGEQLVVSESTVKKHVQNILRKYQARNRAEAVNTYLSGRAQTLRQG